MESAILIPGRRRPGGFTLLEILVVLFIIGIIVTFAALSIDGRAADDRLQQQAERMHSLLDMAADNAILYGVEMGLDVGRDGYRFLKLAQDERGSSGWQIAATDGPLRERKLDDDLRLELIADDEQQPTLAGRADNDEDKKDGVRPEIMFFSSGEITPFELILSAKNADSRYRLSGELTGKLDMQREPVDAY